MTVDPAFLTQTLDRLMQGPLRLMDPTDQAIFRLRYEQHIFDAWRPLALLYGERADFESCFFRFLEIVALGYRDRPNSLRIQDLGRSFHPDWFQEAKMVGYVAYVDRFAGTLKGVEKRIPYLKELGVTYLHLMPVLRPRSGANDGGYAVMDYCQVNPELGTMADLANLAVALRENGISLCIDLVLNHTAKEHRWARRALEGDPSYQAYYHMFPDRTVPDQYELTLPEIFPDFAPGNFSYYEALDRWVWTTFNEYQWDLNYSNPAVFAEFLNIMLYLANQGVDILRLDAVAFMWKRMGTNCQNQPEAHFILQAFRALTRIAAPGLLFKAEAIVGPKELIPYLGRGLATNKECELAYHNSLMVLLWSSLATRKSTLLTQSLRQMPPSPSKTAWITYVRCHDDIGWAVTDENAAAVGETGELHRAFLSDFYSGRFPGTFASGATFQYNPKTGDRRISGSLASLAGLETALQDRDSRAVDMALRRIQLLHNLIFVYGGIPAIYMGDELGMLNDLSFKEDPALAEDNRWMHRPFMDWESAELRHEAGTLQSTVFSDLQKLVAVRKRTPLLHAESASEAVWTHNEHVLGLTRSSPRGRLLVLANVSERFQSVPASRVRELGFGGPLMDLLTETELDGWGEIGLEPYQSLWLEPLE